MDGILAGVEDVGVNDNADAFRTLEEKSEYGDGWETEILPESQKLASLALGVGGTGSESTECSESVRSMESDVVEVGERRSERGFAIRHERDKKSKFSICLPSVREGERELWPPSVRNFTMSDHRRLPSAISSSVISRLKDLDSSADESESDLS